jgi:hypothetical protein
MKDKYVIRNDHLILLHIEVITITIIDNLHCFSIHHLWIGEEHMEVQSMCRALSYVVKSYVVEHVTYDVGQTS